MVYISSVDIIVKIDKFIAFNARTTSTMAHHGQKVDIEKFNLWPSSLDVCFKARK